MTTIFKKTLLATAVFAFAGAAHAVQTPQTAVEYSKQGITQAASVAIADVVFTLEAEYAVGDVIDITFPGAVFHSSNAPAYTVSAADLEIGELSVGTNTIRLRITQQASVSTKGTTLTIADIAFTSASVKASGAVGVTYAAQTSTGLTIDGGATSKPTGKLIDVVDQFEVETTPFNAIINVSDDRLLFADEVDGVAHSTTVDVLTITPTNLIAAPQETPAALTTIGYKVVGDFSFLDQNEDGELSAGELAKLAIGGGNAISAKAVSDDFTTLTFVDTPTVKATPAAVTVTATITGTGAKSDVVLKASDFVATATFNHTSPAGSFAVNESAGAWSLNGSVVRVPYMIVQNGRFSSILNVTNHSSKDGAITLDVFAEDGTKLKSNYPAGTSKAGSVTSVATAVRNALTDSGKDLNTATKYSVQIVTNVPENDVSVYSAYADSLNGGERAIVNNDSKVQTK